MRVLTKTELALLAGGLQNDTIEIDSAFTLGAITGAVLSRTLLNTNLFGTLMAAALVGELFSAYIKSNFYPKNVKH